MSRPLLVASRALGLGDLCTAVPALRALDRSFPTHEIVLAAPAWQEPIAAAAGVDRVVAAEPLGPLPLPPGSVDIAVNLHGRGPESTRRLLELGPRRLIAFRHTDLPETASAPRWRADEHEVDRWCRLLEGCGVPADRDDLALGPAPRSGAAGALDPGPDVVVIHPGAAAAGRRWPVDRFGDVARHVAGRGYRVVITGSTAELDLCGAVARRAWSRRSARGGPGPLVMAGTTLEELWAIVAGAVAVVCNDTGVAHLATALATPSVVLFGPTSPERWGPPALPRHRALWAGRDGDPHASDLDPGLAAITVGEVVTAIDEVLDDDDR